MKNLYDYQAADLKKALDGEHKSWFCAYEVGLGKTLLTVEWAKAVGAKQVIVILPLNTRRSWTNTIKEQIPDADVYWMETKTKERVKSFGYLKAGKPGWYLIGWELMRTGALTGQHADMVVADETHRQQNYNRSDTSTFIQEIDGEYKMALSGTPAGNQPEGIFATINWLWPTRYSSMWKWVDKFWRQLRDGNVIKLIREITPGGVVNDLPMFSRRLRADHRQDLPDTMPEIPIEVELSPMQRKIYDRLAKEAGVWLGDDFISTAIPLAEDIRLRQIALGVPSVNEDGKVSFKENAGSSKVDALIEVLQDNDGTMLVLTHSAAFIPTVVAKLNKKKIKAMGFSGENTRAEKDWMLDNFGKEFRVLVAGIAAIAEGTDGLQYKTHNGFWLSKHPNALLNTQAYGRLNRPGQTEPVNWWYTYAVDTVDERSIERLEEIQDALDEMVDRHYEA